MPLSLSLLGTKRGAKGGAERGKERRSQGDETLCRGEASERRAEAGCTILV